MVLTISISWFEPGDSMWPFHPLVGGHITIWKGHLTIPKRSLWTTWNSNLHSIPIKNRTPEVLFAPNLLFWEFQCRIHVEMMIYVGGVYGKYMTNIWEKIIKKTQLLLGMKQFFSSSNHLALLCFEGFKGVVVQTAAKQLFLLPATYYK